MGEKHVPANDVISVDAKTSRPPFVEVTSTHAANAHCSRALEMQANDWSTSRASSLVACGMEHVRFLTSVKLSACFSHVSTPPLSTKILSCHMVSHVPQQESGNHKGPIRCVPLLPSGRSKLNDTASVPCPCFGFLFRAEDVLRKASTAAEGIASWKVHHQG